MDGIAAAAEETQELQRLASEIDGNRTLRKLVLNAKPGLRFAVYTELCKHITFRPNPFFWMLR